MRTTAGTSVGEMAVISDREAVDRFALGLNAGRQ
jgi:hypothetical protein